MQMFKYTVMYVSEFTGQILEDEGFVGAETYKDALETIADYCGGDGALCHIELYDVSNPISMDEINEFCIDLG